MAEQTFTIGAEVLCSDGPCGQLTRVVVDPVARAVTQLEVEPKLRPSHGRLVPVDLVESSEGEIRLRCTRAEFEKLDPAYETHFVAGTGFPGYERAQVLTFPYYGLGGVWAPGGGLGPGGSYYQGPLTYTEDAVPVGDVEVRRGDHVHATDGEIGKVEGLVIDPDTHKVTHVLLQEGHLWAHKEVTIPIGAVTSTDTGIKVNLTKEQVAELPSVDLNRPGG